MANAITAPPNTYDFGYGFNYSLWTEGTVLTLVNVPWNNDYRDIVKFADRNALNVYINSIQNVGVVVNNVSYVKPNIPIRLDIPFNSAYKYNYLRANNPLQPVSGDVDKDFYYFINDVRYVAPNTTELVLQLDVWQTFGFDVTFGQCYIDRGHIGIANTKAFDNYGRDYLTVPEPIDTGHEYQIVTKKSKALMAKQMSSDGVHWTGGYDVLVVATTDLTADPGTVNNPHLSTAQGGLSFGLPSGADYWIFGNPDLNQPYGGANSLGTYLTSMKQFPWVTQGIISITAIPKIVRYQSDFVYNTAGVPTPAPGLELQPILYSMYPAWRDDYSVVHHIPDRYLGLKKFFTYPYMVIELTTFTGTPIVIKPESWADPDARVVERIAPVPPNQRITVSPYKYNAVPGGPVDDLYPGLPDPPFKWQVGGDDYGEWIEFATQVTSFPAFAIVNNGALGFLAANAHGIAFSKQAAGWQEQRALNTASVTYDKASQAMNLANQLNPISNNADIANTNVANNLAMGKAIVGGVSDVLTGAAGGAQGAAMGAGGALSNGIIAGMSIGANNESLGIRVGASRAANTATQQTAAIIRDTNKSLADYSARGDFENSIAGINAKVQDANLIQPTTSGQVGGETMAMVNNNSYVSMRIKMLDYANMRIVGEYWLRYGYAIHQFITPPASLQVMTKFTYWKMQETYIRSSTIPEAMKQIIRGIFEKGVTVWAAAGYIGVTDLADNQPLSGVTLP